MKILLLFMAIIVSCTTIPENLIRPIDANKYEEVIKFTCKGKMTFAFKGTSSCQYPANTEIDIWVKVPETKGQVVLRSIRKEQVLDFDKDGWIKVKWLLENEDDSVPIAISVAGYGTGIQIAKIYPYVNTEERPFMDLPVNAHCFEDGLPKKSNGLWTCQQPSGAEIDGEFFVHKEKSGKYLIVTEKCNLLNEDNSGSFDQGTESIKFRVKKDEIGFCFIRLNVKYDDDSYQEAEMYADFWNFKYVPLSKPLIIRVKDKVQACAPHGYSYFVINEKAYKNGLLGGKCKKQKMTDGVQFAIGFAEDGRISFSTLEE